MYNILLTGVGGQGLVLLTSVIGNACVKSGKKAITGELFDFISFEFYKINKDFISA